MALLVLCLEATKFGRFERPFPHHHHHHHHRHRHHHHHHHHHHRHYHHDRHRHRHHRHSRSRINRMGVCSNCSIHNNGSHNNRRVIVPLLLLLLFLEAQQLRADFTNGRQAAVGRGRREPMEDSALFLLPSCLPAPAGYSNLSRDEVEKARGSNLQGCERASIVQLYSTPRVGVELVGVVRVCCTILY